jgi:hypothetical protein
LSKEIDDFTHDVKLRIIVLPQERHHKDKFVVVVGDLENLINGNMVARIGSQRF